MSAAARYSVRDTCPCGAGFTTEGQVQGYLQEHHRDWLASHAGCRVAWADGLRVLAPVERAAPAVGEDAPPPWVTPEERRCRAQRALEDTSPGLVADLTALGEVYGPVGVRLTVEQLTIAGAWR